MNSFPPNDSLQEEIIGREYYGWVDVDPDMFGSKEGVVFDGVESPNGCDNGYVEDCENGPVGKQNKRPTRRVEINESNGPR